jgi:thiamine biosynthesis lipoprotein
MHELAFTAMGCEMRLLAALRPTCLPIGGAPGRTAPTARLADARALLERIDATLSRFRPDSELSRLNADPRETVPASPLLRGAVRAALWGAERSGGLVDPTLLAALEDAGYVTSRAGLDAELSLADALLVAPERGPAQPRAASWRNVVVDDVAGTISRPRGLRLDTAGTTKGLAADAAAKLIGGDCVVDCGGDVRVLGAPAEVVVEHPFTREAAGSLRVMGGVATSGLSRRMWRDAGGRAAHHLLDPSTGRSAWTGLVSVTALAPTTLEAEVIAKTALLSGPEAARSLLSRTGGVLVTDDGRAEWIGPASPVVRIPVAA